MSDTFKAAVRCGWMLGALALVSAGCGCGEDIEPGEVRGSIGFASASLR